MDCEKMREIILTDYLDGRIDGDRSGSLEQHFDVCSDCREFARIAREKAVLLFEGAGREAVDESVWDNIKEQVKQKTEPCGINPLEAFLDGWKSWFVFPVPARAWVVTVLVCLVIGGPLAIRQTALAREQADQQAVFYVELVGARSAESGAEADYGTPLEKYFL